MKKRKLYENMNDHTLIFKQAKSLHDSVISEDGTVKFDFMTSLQNIVMAKIATNLWMNINIQQEIAGLFRRYSGKKRKSKFQDNIHSKISNKISQLCLPNKIIEQLTCLVPIVGNAIYKWIRYQNRFIFRTSKNSNFSAADQISCITWTVRGRIDYALTAKSMLANPNSPLSDDHKYKIACEHCFVDEIALLAPYVANQYCLDTVQIQEHPMLYFWSAHVTGDYAKLDNSSFYEHIEGYSTMSLNERIMRMLILNVSWYGFSNEVPIIHIWNKLTEEEKARNIVGICELHNKEIGYSLLSSLNYEQQHEFFKKVPYLFLISILNDVLWEECFLRITLHVLNIMDPESYLCILQELNEKKISQEENKYMYDQYKSFIKELWLKGTKKMKDFIFKHEYGTSIGKLVTYSLSWERDMDIINLLFNDLNKQQKKNIIFGDLGIRCCSNFIESDRWDLLERFINSTLCSEYDIDVLKKTLIKFYGNEIVTYFANEGKLDKIEHFINWAFKSERDRDEFRLNLAQVICPNISDLILHEYKINFTLLESINAQFKMCAKGNLEVIQNLKLQFAKLYFENFSVLLKKDQYEMFDQLLNWCFSENKRQISIFKCHMYKDSNLSHIIIEVTFFLIKRDYSFKLLDKFTGWSFSNNQDVQKFKNWVLYSPECNLNVCAELLKMHRFKFADDFLNWCGMSAEEMSTFKNAFMLTDYMFRTLYAARWDTLDELQSLITWFTPSKETAPKFKKLILDKKRTGNYYEWLDELIERRILLIADCKENNLQDLQERLDNQRLLSRDSRLSECFYRW